MFPRRQSVGVAARQQPGLVIAFGRLLVAAFVLALVGCGTISTTPPSPTPADFQGIAGLLVGHGLKIDHIVSGDAGCDDLTLKRTAIALDASGLDQATPTRIYIYIFRNRAAFERLRQTVDACARSYVTNPDAFESIEASPYVVAAPGPWGAGFKSAIREIFVQAAGTGD
jgi:hypothetical protein